jgi:hypothetical protein
MQEYVYLMRAGDVYKIGRSNKPLRRLVELGWEGKRYSDERLVIMHVITTGNARALERQLLTIFRPWREGIRGEWFRLPPGAADWICRQGDPLETVPAFAAVVAPDRTDEHITLLKIDAAAAFLGVDESAVKHWMKTGAIDFVRIGPILKRIRLSEARRIKKILDS